jgi:hypothetical protein
MIELLLVVIGAASLFFSFIHYKIERTNRKIEAK